MSCSRYHCAATRPGFAPSRAAGLALALLLTLATAPLSAGEVVVELTAFGSSDLQRVQHLVDDVRERLALSHEVTVSVVPENPLVASVKPLAGRLGAFELLVEQGFLDVLTEEDLRAVVAHELGHVWIFTHHPFLHTESLANQIAMRVVSRESLEQVYQKLSDRGRGKTRVTRFSAD